MATRTGTRGDAPTSYTSEGLTVEIARVRMRLNIMKPPKASLRKSLEARLHNLEREQRRRDEESG
jgi:hypothetical protein